MAVFTKLDESTLSYEEQGELSLNDGGILEDVSRRYLYKLQGDAVEVYFDDGSNKGNLFHCLKFDEAGVATATHDCPPDTYQTKMHLISSDAFEIIHIVSGPRKDYKIFSAYKKFLKPVQH